MDFIIIIVISILSLLTMIILLKTKEYPGTMYPTEDCDPFEDDCKSKRSKLFGKITGLFSRRDAAGGGMYDDQDYYYNK